MRQSDGSKLLVIEQSLDIIIQFGTSQILAVLELLWELVLQADRSVPVPEFLIQ